ncbi:putative ABC-type Fe3+-hydroxamate transport system, periplasmic component [Vibrio nigripulchritudo SO65]|uniref:ABC transporter substrate-binding protein n=1 Tax=Vibrio nigripulchritudo TaxID=28173 RepID=UPI0003B23F3F|nr:ABC transporter substrate-binding protein [Vibrio nigripulchritudo]CCN37578.1 putative ABC-type Fe3+-hydroxamate transport system, periplasmic component [Vibrio nigripulchritudo AM115]CCN39560.1 putative ABC-type Fe3+-hydroxamate transport system, periplasmic component [Vibrio nigripulchritudo FTn2]CCN66814.1 putative ABC-type Fe3+-hydroxamate transport system, periplasmic component [Vibrio nigripulchritudo POn4]CCN75660.1 putative ABC-type Fe3+-hydroxamate transport system, periplasmic comp
MKWSAILTLLFPFAVANAADTQYPVTVDNCGSPLTIDKRPTRAVFHDINMTEMAFALDLQESMVGVTGITGWYKMSPSFKKTLGETPELAPKYPSLETLISAKPDFFFAGWNYGMKVGGEVTPQSLKPYGVDTLVLSESCIHTHKLKDGASMELLYGDVKKLGVIFDRQDKANALVKEWKARVKAVAEKKNSSGQPAPKVFLFDSGEDKPFTAGKFAMPNAMINEAGGHNITENMETSWARTSWENVARENPDVIILLDYQTANGADALKDFLEQHPLMKHTNAVKSERYVKLRYEQLTPGPANIEAIEKLSNAFFPQ